MSWKAIGIFAVCAVVLAGIWLGFTRLAMGPEPSRTSGPLFDFGPASVTAVEIDPPGGDEDALRFVREQSGGWSQELGQNALWPISPSRLEIVLRQLAGLQVDAAPSPAPSEPMVITIALADGQEIVARVGLNAIAGRVTVAAEDGATAKAEQALVNALTRPAPSAWKIDRALPDAGLDRADTISLTDHRTATAPTRYTIEQAAGEWRLVSPIPAPLDQDAVRTAIDAWSDMTVREWLVSADAQPEPAPPILELKAGRETPASTTHLTIDVNRIARLEGRTVALSLASFDSEALVPAIVDLLPGVPAQVPPTEVADVKAQSSGVSRLFSRAFGEWREEDRPEDAEAPEIEPDQIDALVLLLTQTSATPSLRLAGRDAELVGTIELMDFAGEPIAELSVIEQQGGDLALASASVMWTFDEPIEHPLFEWMRSVPQDEPSDAPADSTLPNK